MHGGGERAAWAWAGAGSSAMSAAICFLTAAAPGNASDGVDTCDRASGALFPVYGAAKRLITNSFFYNESIILDQINLTKIKV